MVNRSKSVTVSTAYAKALRDHYENNVGNVGLQLDRQDILMDGALSYVMYVQHKSDEIAAMTAYLRGQLLCNGHDAEVIACLGNWKELVDYAITVSGGTVRAPEDFPESVTPTTSTQDLWETIRE